MKKHQFYRYGFYAALFLFIAIGTILIATLSRSRTPNAENPAFMPGMGFAQFRNTMGFAAEQAAVYDELLNDYQGQVQPLRQKLHQEQALIFQLLSDEQTDTAQLNSASLRSAMLQHEIRLATFDHLQKVSTLAGPDQRRQLIGLYNRLLRESSVEMERGGRRHRMRWGQRN